MPFAVAKASGTIACALGLRRRRRQAPLSSRSALPEKGPETEGSEKGSGKTDWVDDQNWRKESNGSFADFTEQPKEGLLPNSLMVNADIPSSYAKVYRHRVTSDLKGGSSRHVLGRTSQSRQKVEWRLQQGPPLAHTNWKYPSRLHIKTGIAYNRRLEQPTFTEVRPSMRMLKQALFDCVDNMHLFEDRSLRMLDLFAGTGQMGLESLSRGASECVFVEVAKDCCDCIIANCWLAGFQDHEDAAKGPINDRQDDLRSPYQIMGGPKAQVEIQLSRLATSKLPVVTLRADVMEFLEKPGDFGMADRTFNHIHASPSFNDTSYRDLCTKLAKTELLDRDGLVSIEYPVEMGSLPPVICAPFDDPDDEDDISAGVPVLQGVRNRRYGNVMLAIYIKLPTGARGQVAEPRPWEFTENTQARKHQQPSRALWKTPSLFKNNQEPGLPRPEKVERLES